MFWNPRTAPSGGRVGAQWRVLTDADAERHAAQDSLGHLAFSGQPLVSLRATPYRREHGGWYRTLHSRNASPDAL